jgi:hypothetical protein
MRVNNWKGGDKNDELRSGTCFWYYRAYNDTNLLGFSFPYDLCHDQYGQLLQIQDTQ